jgi:AcrR family transcriptional regulator
MAEGDDRACIIDAAYASLSEPHSGAMSVAAILQRAGVSTRAFYRHFESKDELFLAMLSQETDALSQRLARICAEAPSGPADQLRAWICGMFGLLHDAQTRMHFAVIDSDEVRAAKGYREAREQSHRARERTLVDILRRGRDDGTFPLTNPDQDAIAISAVISRVMISQYCADSQGMQRAQNGVLDFALRALGASR